MRELSAHRPRRSTWERVHLRITRPVGWTLLAAGVLVWAGIVAVAWFRQPPTLAWLAATAAGVGVAMLAIGIAHEQYREWKTSPYRDIER